MDFLTPSLIGVLLVSITLFFYWLLVFVILYHLVRFGVGTQPKKIAFIFFIGAIGLFFISVMIFAWIDTAKVFDQLRDFFVGLITTKYL